MASRKASSGSDGTGISRRQALGRLGVGLGVAALAGSPRSRRRAPLCLDPAAEAGPRLGARDLLAGIETVVVVMMENRSFDHLLGALSLDRAYPAAALVDGLRGDESNPDADGVPVLVHPQPRPEPSSPLHDWESVAATWNGGRNDRFVTVNAGKHQSNPMSFLDRERLPFHYALADRYTVCDRWFASVMGPTWPNRFYLHAATAEGRRKNRPIFDPDIPTIWDRLRERCLVGKNYCAGTIPWYLAAFAGKTLVGDDTLLPARMEDFFRDARQGTLPALALVDPDYHVNDNHPPHDLRLGDAFVASVFRALAASPQWSRSLFVLTYDEHGGFYDHVPPPVVPDARAPFRRLGFRVPTIVAGPTVRRGAVVSTPFEHVSIAATLAARHGLPSLNPRMDAAADLSVCIDPDLVAHPAPPPRDLPALMLSHNVHLRAPESHSSQPGIDRAVATGRIPEGFVDPRAHGERLASWLRHAQELEAVTLTA